ncbi:helix-turn-helix transcriptional regulator [Propionibacteriaceae bacterium Y2011]|uniref:helix-turn-helix transcriptional regulator n=1 Tax=Microlunatus sp. Y2014 TaxID=3418488 RepID=UPI003B4A768A
MSLSAVHGDQPGHRNTTRQVLGTLTSMGLLSVAPLPPTGRGRPAHGWSLTAAGRSAVDGTDEASTVVGVLASYVVEHGDPDTARKLGVQWSERHAEMVSDASPDVRGLVDVLGALGFDPVRSQADTSETILLRSCPLLGPATQHPEVMCAMHQGMLDGVVQKLGAHQGVELVPFADPQGCRVDVGEPPA